MPDPLPDPKLRRALEKVDSLERELRTERVRSGNLKAQLAKAREGLAMDAKPQPQVRAG